MHVVVYMEIVKKEHAYKRYNRINRFNRRWNYENKTWIKFNYDTWIIKNQNIKKFQ